MALTARCVFTPTYSLCTSALFPLIHPTTIFCVHKLVVWCIYLSLCHQDFLGFFMLPTRWVSICLSLFLEPTDLILLMTCSTTTCHNYGLCGNDIWPTRKQVQNFKWKKLVAALRKCALFECMCPSPQFHHSREQAIWMEYIFATIEVEMEALCITLNRDAPLSMSFLPVVHMMSSRLFPAFSAQERQLWNTSETTTSNVHCVILCTKGGNNLKQWLFFPMVLKSNANLLVLFHFS
jgi:hypothetical protein